MTEEFFCNDIFHSSLEDFIDYNEWDREQVESLPEDFKLEVLTAKKEPIVKLSAEWIVNHINEERFSEENYDQELERVTGIIADNIDFDNEAGEILIENIFEL